MTAKKRTSRSSAGKNDGNNSQILARSCNKSKKNAVKYTIWRSKEDIAKINKVRDHLERDYFHKSYKADSKIYKELPDLYLNAVKKNLELDQAINVLTAKLEHLEDLRASFCRIFELCEIKK